MSETSDSSVEFNADTPVVLLERIGPQKRVSGTTPNEPDTCTGDSSAESSDETHTVLLKQVGPRKRGLSVPSSESDTCSTKRQRLDSTEAVDDVIPKNTNREVHCGSKYNTTCVLCDKKCKGMVRHFINEHADSEVYVSRPSPGIIDRIKTRCELTNFEVDASKRITGTCYFCGHTRTHTKARWERHMLTHSGEKMFFCRDCDGQFDKKSANGVHDNCASSSERIYDIIPADANGTFGDGLYGHFCVHCSYMQFNCISMERHLRLQHNLEHDLSGEYESYQLVPWIDVNGFSDAEADNSD